MRENIAIILNAKNKKEAIKEMHRAIDYFREDEYLDTEYELCFTRSYFEEEYEDFKEQYRVKSKCFKEDYLERLGCRDIEDYINLALDRYGWSTLEEYVLSRYNVIRFEGQKAIGVYNPNGYIDYVDRVIALKKYKDISSRDLKKYSISKVVFKDKNSVDETIGKSLKVNKMILHQSLRNNAKGEDYIAIVRVHF